MTVRSTNITTTEHRVVKEARRGDIPEFTGISAPYETPDHPELAIDTGTLSVEESLAILIEYVDHAFAVPEEAISDGAALGP